MVDVKEKIRSIIFEASTPAGRAFDVFLIIVILLSVLVVLLDSVTSIHSEYGQVLLVIEWSFTLLFTVEYLLRLWTIQNTWLYARSFYGVVDLLGSLPTEHQRCWPAQPAWCFGHRHRFSMKIPDVTWSSVINLRFGM